MQTVQKIQRVKQVMLGVTTLYVLGISFPWIQAAFDATPRTSVISSPTEYATATSLAVAAYGSMFVAPLFIAGVYLIRKYRRQIQLDASKHD